MTKKYLNENSFIKTSDIALASTIALFYSLEAIDKPETGGRAFFIFKRDAKLDKLIEAYWKRELQVEPQAYFQQLRAIKARLYE